MAAEEAEAPNRLLIEALALTPDVQPVDEKVRAGEIVGLAGLDGHGQEAFLEALCGLHPPASGRVMVVADRHPVPVTSFPQAVRHGVAYAGARQARQWDFSIPFDPETISAWSR